jgi:hypothetical protein
MAARLLISFGFVTQEPMFTAARPVPRTSALTTPPARFTRLPKGGRKDETWHTPLRELKKQFHLTTLTFTNHSNWFTNSRLREYSGRESDAVLVIDSRTIPQGVQVSVMVGLLEPGRLDIVQSLVMLPRQVTDFIPLQPKQILVSTAVEPWIYVVLHWIALQHEGPADCPHA